MQKLSPDQPQEMYSAAKRILFPILLATVTATFAAAQKASINLSCFPSISVADGHSTVTVTAEVRDLNGSIVRDGTPVVFETDKGTFRGKNVIESQNGFARIVLTAPGVPGTAKVRANVFSQNASGTLEIDFVNDRSVLDSAKEFIEIATNENVSYATQDKILDATGNHNGAVLHYRDVVVRADQMQLRVSSYELRARNAQLTLGKRTETFRELYFKLNTRKGIGLIWEPKQVPVLVKTPTGAMVTTKEVPEFKALDVSFGETKPHEGNLNESLLSFLDTSAAMSTVEAKKAVVSPSRGVQFQKAAVKLGGQTVMSLPLFQVDLNTSSPVITEQFFNVSNSSVAINYPYYLSLKPGETSLLRFRYGNRYSSGLGATGGTYLDYEYNWNHGANMEGGLNLRGLARDDWGAGVRQLWSPDPTTSVSAQLDFPAHRSLFANFGANKRFNGFQTNLNVQHGRSLSGDRFQNDSVALNIDGDPIAIGKLPMSMTFGLTAQQQRITGDASSFQQGAGLQARLDSRTLFVDPRDSLTFSYTMTRWAGTSVSSPLTQVGSISLASNWLPGLYLQTTYEYGQDGFSEDVLGRHRLTMDGIYSVGRFNVRSFLSKSLDVDRTTANLNLDYKLDSYWRVSAGYLLDRYSGDTFLEQTLVLGYRIGFREIGLSYSTRTKRLGIELLGTRFN
ncbi:MAG: hypothetical protein JSS66_10620 [Armatimonadetes bacterium]|nr:hypothetical protein [Armatimonadota bacterium]